MATLSPGPRRASRTEAEGPQGAAAESSNWPTLENSIWNGSPMVGEPRKCSLQIRACQSCSILSRTASCRSRESSSMQAPNFEMRGLPERSVGKSQWPKATTRLTCYTEFCQGPERTSALVNPLCSARQHASSRLSVASETPGSVCRHA